MLRKLFLGYLLTLLLLLGQQGVLAHEISHLQDYSQQDQAPHSGVCDQCLSLVSLDNLISGSSYILPATHSLTLKPVASPTLDHSQLVRNAYSARAPPTHIQY